MNQQEQMEFFYEIFDASLPRLGPGNDASTKKALELLSRKSEQKTTARFSAASSFGYRLRKWPSNPSTGKAHKRHNPGGG